MLLLVEIIIRFVLIIIKLILLLLLLVKVSFNLFLILFVTDNLIFDLLFLLSHFEVLLIISSIFLIFSREGLSFSLLSLEVSNLFSFLTI